MRLGIGSWLLSAALIVAGCGGGGSGSSTNPPSPVAPTVSLVTPSSGATGVAISSAVTATFSLTMNSATLTASTFTLTPQGGAAVAGTVSYNSTSSTATFTPSANLAYNTKYTATITTGAAASSGTALTANYTWTFTTAPGPPPTVTSVTPQHGSTGVAINASVMATFSEAMNSSTLTASTFALTPQGGGAVSGTVSYDSSSFTATFTPAATLAYATNYTATITTAATASTGSALAATKTWTFSTAAAPVPPTVTAVSPANGATNVAVNSPVAATFSEAMNAASITASSFTVVPQGGSAVAGTIAYNGGQMTATFTPSASLAYNKTYTGTITTSAAASNGAALVANYTWTFTTAPQPAPTVTATVPANGAAGIGVSNAVTATFSQAMDSTTITSSTFTLSGSGGAVSGNVTYTSGTSTATFTPASALAYSTTYTATITTGARNTGGTALASNYSWSFTTAANPSSVSVDFGTSYQTIRGFGGSTAWLGQLTSQQATALFSPTSGLGLSILRARIDPEGSAGSNWQTGQWTWELNNALAAQSANQNAIVFASPWTPPPSMKTSSTSQPYYSGTAACSPGAGYCGGYLDPNHYADYAAYLEDFVSYFKNGGVNLYAISMQNEPDWSAQPSENYESCSWTAAQMDSWIAANGSTLTTKLMMPESLNFNKAMANSALQDPNAASLISIIGGHLYGVTNPLPNYSAQQSAGMEVWMTEHTSCDPNCPASPGIADAVKAAQEVHNSMVTGDYNAYVWWWIWNNPADGITYGLINSSTTSPAPTYYGYALGQYAKFIQPGYVRVSATANPMTNVYVSAYSGNGHFVIVVINAGTTAPTLAFALNNASVTSLTPYQTTSGGGMAQQSTISVAGGQFNYTLPAQSITTLEK